MARSPAAGALIIKSAASVRITGGPVRGLRIAESALAAGTELVVTENRRHFTAVAPRRSALTCAEFAEDVGL